MSRFPEKSRRIAPPYSMCRVDWDKEPPQGEIVSVNIGYVQLMILFIPMYITCVEIVDVPSL